MWWSDVTLVTHTIKATHATELSPRRRKSRALSFLSRISRSWHARARLGLKKLRVSNFVFLSRARGKYSLARPKEEL